MNLDFRIEFQPQLAEEAVLRAMANHPEESLFRQERDRLYEGADGEDRERAFQDLHHRWLNRLGLIDPLRQVLAAWPILATATGSCLLTKARSKKAVGAELYVAPQQPEPRERRTIVIQLTPELLSQSQPFLNFLRHELLHVVDMLHPDFGYEPDFPKTNAGPAFDHFLQSRYSVLWDITIDGRLHQNGWLPAAAREKHWAIFQRMFQGTEAKLAEAFSHFFDEKKPAHRELMDFAQHPEKWLDAASAENSSNGRALKGRCAICQFPTFQLIAPSELRAEFVTKIQEHYPAWNGTEPVCRQCVDLYEAKLHVSNG
jgi:hypothetical protein